MLFVLAKLCDDEVLWDERTYAMAVEKREFHNNEEHSEPVVVAEHRSAADIRARTRLARLFWVQSAGKRCSRVSTKN